MQAFAAHSSTLTAAIRPAASRRVTPSASASRSRVASVAPQRQASPTTLPPPPSAAAVARRRQPQQCRAAAAEGDVIDVEGKVIDDRVPVTVR